MAKILIAAFLMLNFCVNAHSSNTSPSANANINHASDSLYTGMSQVQVSLYRTAVRSAHLHGQALITLCHKIQEQLNAELASNSTINFATQIYIPKMQELYEQQDLILTPYEQYVAYHNALKTQKQDGSITASQFISQIAGRTLDFIAEMNQRKSHLLSLYPNISDEASAESPASDATSQNP